MNFKLKLDKLLIDFLLNDRKFYSFLRLLDIRKYDRLLKNAVIHAFSFYLGI